MRVRRRNEKASRIVSTIFRRIIEYQGRKLKHKELLVKDHQGRIMNRKEITMSTNTAQIEKVANS